MIASRTPLTEAPEWQSSDLTGNLELNHALAEFAYPLPVYEARACSQDWTGITETTTFYDSYGPRKIIRS